ncbi:MAG TPA: MlaD family protein [Cyclobacteriaceae bacterium]|nr:MlaD family protein [Cyclobacteriaceae bacterium]
MKFSREIKVGLFMTIAIVMLYFSFNYLKGIDFLSKTSKYYTFYNNVAGLAVSSPVFVNGYAVGRVSDIQILQQRQNMILVEIDITSKVILGDSTKAILKSDLFGSKSIELIIGSIERVKAPGDTLLAELDKGIAEIFAESAQPVANNLESTIKKINAILDNLTGNSNKLNKIMDDIAEAPILVNQTLEKTNQAIDEVKLSLTTTTDKLKGTLNATDPILQNLKVTTDSLKQLELRKTLLQVQNTLDNLNETLNGINQSEGTFGKLMNDDALYNNLLETVQSLDELVNHMNTNPKHFFAPLGKSAKRIERDLRRQEEAAGN